MSDSPTDGLGRIHGPHRVPLIACDNCGHEHHIDAAAGEYQGHCAECNAYLRRPTDAEERKFALFMDWKNRHIEGIGSDDGLRPDGGRPSDEDGQIGSTTENSSYV